MKILLMLLMVMPSLSAYGMSLNKEAKYVAVRTSEGPAKAKAPKWVDASGRELEKMYSDYYPVKLSKYDGKNLQSLEKITKIEVAGKAATEISQSISDYAKQTISGGDDNMANIFEQLVEKTARVTIPGMKEEDDWWVEYESKDVNDKDANVQVTYEYNVLYLLDKAIVKSLILQEFEGLISISSPELQEAAKIRINQFLATL